MSVFVHPQGIKTVHAGRGRGKKGQNSVHVVVELCQNKFILPIKIEMVENIFRVSRNLLLCTDSTDYIIARYWEINQRRGFPIS